MTRCVLSYLPIQAAAAAIRRTPGSRSESRRHPPHRLEGTVRPSLLHALLLCAALLACATEQSARRPSPAPAPTAFPTWLGAPANLERSPELEEAAALLCARDTDAVIDEDVRQAARVYDGQVAGLVRRGNQGEARAALQRDLPAILEELGASHAGIAEGQLLNDQHCAALVAVRRHLDLGRELPTSLEENEPFPLDASLRAAGPWRAHVYLLRPDGHVERRERGGDGVFSDVVLPDAGEGMYLLEVVLTGANDDPEVALLWPFVVGTPKSPPAPLVLFPDEGHGEVALRYRTQALVERLRNTQLLDPVAISPDLDDLAEARARALAHQGRLGHRLPSGQSAAEGLGERAPAFAFSHLAEVQAQAGTLQDAWTALLTSPAHRYELVRPRATHMGAAVARGTDSLGRPLLSVVVLLAKKLKVRPKEELATELLGKLNLARHRRGHAPLGLRPSLQAVATRQAEAMLRLGTLDETALGAPVSEVALSEDGALTDVRVVVARLDDPLRLSPPSAALEEDQHAIGVGLARGPATEWFLCLLVAGADSEP